MDKDKNQLEIKISKTAIDIFSLKKSDDFDESEYKTLFTKLSDLIWRWAKITFGQKVENASIEIIECIKRSISSFNGNLEEYIKYISAGLKKEINIANKKNQVFEEELIKNPEKKRRLINSILKYAERYGKNLNSDDDVKEMASVFNLSEDETRECLQWKHQANVLQDYSTSSDGEEYSLIDSFISEHNYIYAPETNFFIKHEKQEFEKKAEKLFCLVEDLYLQEKDKTENQKSAKQYLSSLITRLLFDELSKVNNFDKEKICESLEKKDFVDKSMMQSFKDNKIPTQQEVAAWYNKDKTDASRKLKTFLQKLQEKLSTIEKVDSSA
jgi:hypothetical protein